MKNKTLPIIELIVYYCLNVVTIGGAWFAKIIIKKAINEANISQPKHLNSGN